jgi:hypothetical protein
MVVVVLGTESSTTPRHSLTEAKGTQQAAIPTLKDGDDEVFQRKVLPPYGRRTGGQ